MEILIPLGWFSLHLKELCSAVVLKCSFVCHMLQNHKGYSVSTSVLPKVIQYIRNQQEHHKVRTFMDEYKAFLKANGIDYEERYL